MHVLHIFKEINFSGAEIMYADAAIQVQQQGIKMTAMATGLYPGDFVAEFEKLNVPVIYQPFPKGTINPIRLYRYVRDLYRFIKKEKVDLIHVHRSDVFWYYSLCGTIARKNVIMTPHSVFKNRTFTWPKAWLERWTARKFMRTTFQTISESVYKNELDYYKNPSIRVNNWYNPNRFYPASEGEKLQIRQRLGIAPDQFVIISAGSCTHIKNHQAILEGLAAMHNRESCTYLHLGKGQFESCEKEKSEELKLSSNVRFLGNQLNVRDYLVASDVYVMTSRFEGLSIAAIEAMACRIPCVLYRSPGLWDLIKNDDNGFLINADPTLVADKLTILRNDPALATQKGLSGQRFVKQNFDLEQQVNKMIGLYKELSA